MSATQYHIHTYIINNSVIHNLTISLNSILYNPEFNNTQNTNPHNNYQKKYKKKLSRIDSSNKHSRSEPENNIHISS